MVSLANWLNVLANQTQNFTALMNNFQVAIDATATAMDSAGSAMKENASYMESLQAQTTQLKATFQDFANNVIDKELVSTALTSLNNALEALNTPVGKAITQWTLLTGVFTGGITIYGQIAGKLGGIAKTVGIDLFNSFKNLTMMASGVQGPLLATGKALGTATSMALPFAAALSAVAIAGWEFYKWYKETHKSLQEYTEEIQSNTEQLEANRDRLAEIEQMSWTDKTPEILDEYDALVQQNEELQRNIDLLEKRRTKQATRQAREGGQVQQGSSYGFEGLAWSANTEAEAWQTLASTLGMAGASVDKVKEKANELGYTLQENTEMVKVNYLEYDQHLIKALEEYQQKILNGRNLTNEEIRDYQNLKTEVAERVEGLQQLSSQGDTLYYTENKLIDTYNSLIDAEADATEFADKYTTAVKVNELEVNKLKSVNPELSDSIVKVGNAYYFTGDSALAQASKIMDANGNIIASEKGKVNEVLAGLQAQMDGYAAVIKAKQALYGGFVRRGTQDTEAGRQAESEWIAAAQGWAELQKAQSQLEAAVRENRYTSGGTTDTSPGSSSTSTKSSAQKVTDEALEQFKSYQKDLKHQLELGQITQEQYYDALEKLVAKYKEDATAHMKEYGLTVNQINQNMYEYEEEIYKGRAQLAEDLAEQQKQAAEEAAQAQKEALEKQKEEFETAVNYVIKQIDAEISKLQDLRDQTEQYYDDKIDALNETNDALEDQIKYEELLNNLAQAKDKQLYVFQNGQFQYVQDVEAIASAQAELDAYERDKALQQEIDNLETLKEQALASIDEQIEGWEDYKEQWSNVVDQYQDEQDRLIAEQVLGIDLEQENWNKRLTNLQSFVDQYNSILSQLNSGTSGTSSGGTSGGSSTGNGYYFDYSKGTSGWTEQEMLESDPSYSKSSGSSGSSGGKYTYNGKNVYQSAYDSYVAKGDYESANQVIEEAEARGQTVSKHAIGTLSAPGGLSLVGERGPELRVLNSGDGIIPADVTRNLWDWANYNPRDFMNKQSGNNVFQIDNLSLPNVKDAQSFVTGLKQLAYQRAYKRA